MARLGDEAAMIAAAAAGLPLRQVADASGLSMSSVKRRLTDGAVRAAVDEVRAQLLDQAVGRLAGLRAAALDRLTELLADPSPVVGLRAVELSLVQSVRHQALFDQERRLAVLEAAAQCREGEGGDGGDGWEDVDHAPDEAARRPGGAGQGDQYRRAPRAS